LLTTKCYDLNLSLGRQSNKKITSGHPDGKHNLQGPTSYKIWSLANHFAKSTKYMTEESERYMDHPKLQVAYDLTRSRIQGCVSAYNLIGSRTRGYKPPTTLLDPESKVHKPHATSLGPKPGTQDKRTTRPELLRAVTTTYSAKAGHVARLLLASRP
jgi:hypothetical protein